MNLGHCVLRQILFLQNPSKIIYLSIKLVTLSNISQHNLTQLNRLFSGFCFQRYENKNLPHVLLRHFLTNFICFRGTPRSHAPRPRFSHGSLARHPAAEPGVPAGAETSNVAPPRIKQAVNGRSAAADLDGRVFVTQFYIGPDIF